MLEAQENTKAHQFISGQKLNHQSNHVSVTMTFQIILLINVIILLLNGMVNEQ